MSAIGYDSGFYDRLDQFSRSLNHVLLASSGKPAIARDSDWNQILELIQTLASKPTLSIATASVAACIKGHFPKVIPLNGPQWRRQWPAEPSTQIPTKSSTS